MKAGMGAISNVGITHLCQLHLLTGGIPCTSPSASQLLPAMASPRMTIQTDVQTLPAHPPTLLRVTSVNNCSNTIATGCERKKIQVPCRSMKDRADQGRK